MNILGLVELEIHPVRSLEINVEVDRLNLLGINLGGDIDRFYGTRVEPVLDAVSHKQSNEKSHDPADEERSWSHLH
jgi:hypothetical protein